MPKIRVSMGEVLIKNAVLGVPRWKTPIFFSLLVICWSWNVSQSSLISRNLLYPENRLLAWSPSMVGWHIKRNVSVFDPLEHLLFQRFHALKSLYFKVYFSFTWHLEFSYTDLLQFKHKYIYLFATNLTNKQYNRQEQS